MPEPRILFVDIETAPIKVPSQGIVEATFNYKSSGTITHAYA